MKKQKPKLKVLSLFDGISCAQVALERLGYDLLYFASEVEPHSIAITQKNFPRTIQIGDVTKLDYSTLGEWRKDPLGIDLLIGGSPCQDLSVAKNGREGLKGSRSKLFYEYVRILKEVKPKWFVLENVASMSFENKCAISDALGVDWIEIDASLVSAQSRKRLFWTNIPNIGQPKDRGIFLKDIIEGGYPKDEKSRTITASYHKGNSIGNLGTHRERTMIFNRPIQIGTRAKGMSGRIYSPEGKSVTLKAGGGGSGACTGLYQLKKGDARSLTPIECERLQSLPDNYTEGFPKTHRIRALGDAFNVEVVKHILSHIPKK